MMIQKEWSFTPTMRNRYFFPLIYICNSVDLLPTPFLKHMIDYLLKMLSIKMQKEG